MRTETVSYFLMGLGAGAALGLLLAPTSGAETRAFLADKSKEGKDHIKHSADRGVDYLKRQADDVKTTASQTVERAKAAAKAPGEIVSRAVDAGKKAYSDAFNKAATESSL
jgi:gas vesicle protein